MPIFSIMTDSFFELLLELKYEMRETLSARIRGSAFSIFLAVTSLMVSW